MKIGFWSIATILLGCLCGSYTANGQPWQKEFLPPSGKGRAVVVFSGHTGPGSYAYFAKDLAAQGYYVVLVNGNDFWKKGLAKNDVGLHLYKDVIERAQQSPHALPGKVAVVGFSLGGGATLTYGTRMPDLVYAIVVYYPETSFITNPNGFVSRMKVPILMFAGVLDTYKDCCVIERARQLAAVAAKEGRSLRLVEYPDAGHGFSIKNTKNWRGNDSANAFRRTLDYLKQSSA